MYNPQLDTFLRVADAGSFNKAAEESYITPTAVIKQINLLESSLGVKFLISGYKVYHPVLQGLRYAGEKCHARGHKYYPYRNFTYDSRTVIDAAMAEDSGTMPGYEISDYSIRKHTGKCP